MLLSSRADGFSHDESQGLEQCQQLAEDATEGVEGAVSRARVATGRPRLLTSCIMPFPRIAS